MKIIDNSYSYDYYGNKITKGSWVTIITETRKIDGIVAGFKFDSIVINDHLAIPLFYIQRCICRAQSLNLKKAKNLLSERNKAIDLLDKMVIIQGYVVAQDDKFIHVASTPTGKNNVVTIIKNENCTVGGKIFVKGKVVNISKFGYLIDYNILCTTDSNLRKKQRLKNNLTS